MEVDDDSFNEDMMNDVEDSEEMSVRVVEHMKNVWHRDEMSVKDVWHSDQIKVKDV